MACELLLLGREPEGLPLLLIEEPEAHLHPQRQLRLMDFLSRASAAAERRGERSVQVILSTHSPNLASQIPVPHLVMLERGRAFSLGVARTRLAESDYRFLARFLDVTKANLFFAHGVVIVEGDAEAILLPVVARLMGHDLTEHGVSIVNVGGTGLRRFSKVFQRSAEGERVVSIPVACLADLDVMPDCAPRLLGLVNADDDPQWTNPRRRWRAMRDLSENGKTAEDGLADRRRTLCADDGQTVKTFVSDHWTLEYDLAYAGLAKEVYVAAQLAKNDDAINESKKSCQAVQEAARTEFAKLEEASGDARDDLCSRVYDLFHSRQASKAIAAQYLAEALDKEGEEEGFDPTAFSTKVPKYIREAIAHVTAPIARAAPAPANRGRTDG